ncbi:MAG: universal stress protein [Planctomycetes bacterium]|nr:universal stress protein [Planctomycetota bacterium]
MITLKKILFATDFSDCAKAAQAYAAGFAEQFHAELHVLHVLPDVALMMPDPGTALTLPANYLLDLKNEAQKSLDQLLPASTHPGLAVVRSVCVGNPFVEIVNYAEAQGIDLIVVGTHGRGALLHLLMGSVAEKVVRKAKCPVLTVRPHEHA